ncbi:MAG: hypothetical protein DWQ47_17530 [Acidobacteria bacterium]|nr:MAG: hypothetical protein DWQ32_04930 [Acidobacteriota bacterium]REK02159.1 MAG: hypothetical protein DWQ38_07225 [Acidobacteriota bacterium]REK14039.1 MAG: hypothetical protein DWQ43_10620 [Acidobacteriota bacterium]REK42034.1 MAG: hypothetical protein DWQ47_17530 [Acidobacteriota bacterium]
MKLPSRRFYEFSSFRVDVAERTLLRDGEPVPLTPKVFDILLVLLENAGRTVEKDRLMDEVWTDTIVEEGNLNRNISTLRKVLGDDAQSQRFIKTIPKCGYRFTSEIREIIEDEAQVVIEDRTRFRLRYTDEEGKSGFPGKLAKASGLVFLLLLGAFAGVVAWFWLTAGAAESRTSAVVNQEDKNEALRLYRQGREHWRTRDGKDLHEAIVLFEAAIARDPGFARAHAALGDAYAFDLRLWRKAEKSARKALALDPEMGEAHATIGLVKMMWEWDFEEAEREFKQAIRLTPDYAPAHQWYAINLHAIGYAGHAAHTEMQKAIELDPESVSINADLCQTLYFLWRFEEAEQQCRRTLKLDPESDGAYQYLFEIYSTVGRHEDAVQTYIKMKELALSPLPPEVMTRVRAAFERGGHVAFRRELISFMSESWPQNYRIARQYAWMGEQDEAFVHLEKALNEREFDMFLFIADPAFLRYKGDPRYDELVEKMRNSSVPSQTPKQE